MSWLVGFARGAYYFFAEDGSIVIGAIVALVVVGALAVWRPIGSAALFGGPLLFLLIASLLVVNLLLVARQARAHRSS